MSADGRDSDDGVTVDRGPAEAAFEVVAVDDGARVPIRYLKLAIAVAAMVVVALVGVDQLTPEGDAPPSRAAVAPQPSPSSSPSLTRAPSSLPAVASNPNPFPYGGEIVPGTYWMDGSRSGAESPMRIRLTMPAGWWSADAGTTISRHPTDDPGPILTLTVHDVTRIATDAWSPNASFVEVGPTVEDLMTAISNMIGTQPGPAEVRFGGHLVRRFVLGYSDPGPGPEERRIWERATGRDLPGLLKGGTTTVDVVDVNGHRLVLTSVDRGSSADDLAELDAIMATIVIEPAGTGPIEPLPAGSHPVTVDDVTFSFSAPAHTPGGWARFGGISVNKSIAGPQGAEAMIYWTSFPGGGVTDPCGDLRGLPDGISVADLAAAVSKAPGTELVAGPSDVIVGGRAAKHLVLTVRDDVGCDPGYFFTWHDLDGGPLWPETLAGDTIRVWIVEMDGTRLFIAGETHADLRLGEAMTEAEQAGLDREIRQIVDSIRFERDSGPG